jgi:hypothetical protein
LPELAPQLTVVDSFGKVQPPVPINKMGPTLQDIIRKTAVPLQWDALDSTYIVYPVGQARARWKDGGADSEGEEVETDGYKDAYAGKSPKAGDDEDED